MLVFAGESDGIAPVRSIRPMVDLLTGAPSVRFEVVPGGHLGMLTGRASRRTTWRIIDEFLDEHASGGPEKKSARKSPAKKSATKKAAAKKSAPKKTAAKGQAAEKATAKKAARKSAPRSDAIGSNPARRYGSESSRSLASGS
jgi:polyhydroxyalkanoate synthase